MKGTKSSSESEITVPKGYDIFDLIDTDDGGYDFGQPIIMEEVKIRFERENTTE